MILLDTQALVWLDAADTRLGPKARLLVDDALGEGELGVSAICFCEVAWLRQAGRVSLRLPVLVWRTALLEAGLTEIPIDGEIAVAAVELPGFHKDPGDRLIVATAIELHASLVTSDARILAWGGPLLRLDARL